MSNNKWSYHEISYAIYNIFIWFLRLLVKTNQNRLDKEAFYLKYFSVWAYISSWRPQYPLTCHKYSWDRELYTPYLYFMDFAVIFLYIIHFLWIKVNSLDAYFLIGFLVSWNCFQQQRTRGQGCGAAIVFGINVYRLKVWMYFSKIFKILWSTKHQHPETHSLS